ncbi:hypothetical protein DFJ77DRAFT_445302 [Powellomyces hirtus]|nr:hypothetical protein DFJ77DRAFT_445302 [Powellomyces hirtus]
MHLPRRSHRRLITNCAIVFFLIFAAWAWGRIWAVTRPTSTKSQQPALTNENLSGSPLRTFDYTSIEPVGENAYSAQEAILRISPQIRAGCRAWAVLTVTSAVTDSVRATAKALRGGWCMVVVANRGGPREYVIDGTSTNVYYLNVTTQETWARWSPFVASLPWNHAGRKNVGYLWAIAHGATVIWDFEVGTSLGESLLQIPTAKSLFLALPGMTAQVLNPFPVLGSDNGGAWPRGFPLAQVRNASTITNNTVHTNWDHKTVGIVHSVASGNSDVDTIFRYTQPLPLTFSKSTSTKLILLPQRTFAPYNSHSTLHLEAAFWCLLLPTSPNVRVSDIWRGYAVQRLLWDADMQVTFSGPWVSQDGLVEPAGRADLQSEHDLYTKTWALLMFLQSWVPQTQTIPQRFEELYIELYKRGYVEMADVLLVRGWIRELELCDYRFPRVPTPPMVAIL